MTNAPIMLNVDCDMFANNPEVVLHGMCVLLGSDRDQKSGFVQSPQRFYGGIRDDPFGNQFIVAQHYAGMGVDGLGCTVYAGTGCFHRRKVIYGVAPELEGEEPAKLRGPKVGTPSPQELERRFGRSREMQESAAWIISAGGPSNTTPAVKDLTVKQETAKQVASCAYEVGTCWGREIGWVYGTATEDIQTGLRIHSKGWRSVRLDPEPPAFLGCSPVGGPATMNQYKRWATGLLEVLMRRDGPLLATLAGKLAFRRCLVYVLYGIWALRSAPELCYVLLAPYCAFTNTSFLPKVSEPTFLIPALLFVFYNVYTLTEYLECELSVRTWWNNQRMQRIQWTTPSLFGLFSVVTKVLGMSETTFEITPKEQNSSPTLEAAPFKDPGRFTFDSSPMFVPDTALVFLNFAAAATILLKLLRSPAGVTKDSDGPGIAELVCSVWVVLSFWPFVRGLFGKGSYGLPWSTILKGSALSSLYLLFCKW
ncbi:hypothetical protein Taro_027288 [Colocasia esculenta]|uniref:Cellulose synthase-like protein H1 n=1 Tax=Colocasia esculenta TaxID=4460 RepID=A0A843VFC6_COLES|nr:hypothetical protein [Colocasia esculenta]